MELVVQVEDVLASWDAGVVGLLRGASGDPEDCVLDNFALVVLGVLGEGGRVLL